MFSQLEEQIKKKFNLKVILNLKKGTRNLKQMQTSDITSFFSGNILNIVPNDQLRTSVDLWMFRMRSLKQKSHVNFKQQRL